MTRRPLSGAKAAAPEPTESRLDAWLWHARFLRKRGVAAELCSAGRVRVSGRVVDKAHATVRVGDVLTFPLGRDIRVIKILALPPKRGPAAEMRACYEDLFPPTRPAPGAGEDREDANDDES